MAAFLRKPEYFWPLVWGSASVVLAGVVALELWADGRGAGERPRQPARVAEAKLLPPFALPPEASSGSETVARPLFLPGRRPAPPAAADAGTMKKGQFVLQGTTIVGPLAYAMLKEVGSGKVHRVRQGERVKDVTLSEVGPVSVVLTLGSDSETLPLLVAKGSGQPASAPDRGPFRGAAPAAAPAVPAVPAMPAGRPAVPSPATAPSASSARPATAAAAVPPQAADPSDTAAIPQPSSTPPGMMTEELFNARRRLPARASQPPK
jgi:hypothetical protein